MYTSLWERLKNQHQAIRFIIEKPDNTRLTKQLIQGKWTIKDNIAHLAKYQPVFLNRVKLILANDNLVFERYKAENDPEFETWRQYDLSTLLDKLDEDRINIFNTITDLTPAELSKTGVHKKYGALTIMEWTEFFLLHEAHHIFTIFQLIHYTEL
jgi:hypothetical protein